MRPARPACHSRKCTDHRLRVLRRLSIVSGSRALLLLLALVAIAAGVFVWFGQDPTDLPGGVGGSPNETGTTQLEPQTGGTPAGPNPATGGTNAPQSATGDGRVQVSVAGDDDALCELRVQVAYFDNGIRTPIAFTEVTVQLADDVTAYGESRTDGGGSAEFAFAGGDGEAVVARAANGGIGRATLSADEPTVIEIVVEPRVLATGKVVDSSNVGVTGADIVLLRWPPDDHSAPDLWRIGQSGPGGNFRLPVRFGGRIGAMHPAYASSALYLLRPGRAGAQTKVEVFELLLQPVSVEVQGTVHAANGRPLPDAVIEVHTAKRGPRNAERPGPPHRARSDANGNFRVVGLPPGEAQWFCKKSGHGWSYGSVTLPQAGTHRIGIQMPRPAQLTGTVIDQATREPVAGATVVAGLAGTLCHGSTITGKEGTFTITDLGIGTVAVRASKKSRRVARTIELTADQAATWHAELPPVSGDTLTGRVVDQDDKALGGWLVVVRQGDRDPVRLITEEDGTFEGTVQQQRDLDVRVFAPGRPPTAFADLTQRGVSTGSPVNLVVRQRDSVAVRGRILDGSATGVAATIGVWHYEHREYARFKANQDGTFEIACPTGTVDLTIEHPGHAAHYTGSMPLTRGLPTDLGTITLQLGGGLYGTVMGPGGTPPPDCELKLLLAGRPPMLAEFHDGSYRFRDVPAGEHTLVVQGEEIAGASFSIPITAGNDLHRIIEVSQGVHRRIRVAVPSGGGSRVTLALRSAGSGTRWYASGNVARDGAGETGFAIFETWMVAGTYEARAVTPDGYEANENLTYEGGSSQPFVMRVEPR